jgi:hypothetical protein
LGDGGVKKKTLEPKKEKKEPKKQKRELKKKVFTSYPPPAKSHA